jgi:hypothetical protein
LERKEGEEKWERREEEAMWRSGTIDEKISANK